MSSIIDTRLHVKPISIFNPLNQSNGALDAGSLDDIVALQVHLTGAPLDNIERELAVYSPTWEVCAYTSFSLSLSLSLICRCIRP